MITMEDMYLLHQMKQDSRTRAIQYVQYCTKITEDEELLSMLCRAEKKLLAMTDEEYLAFVSMDMGKEEDNNG